jgi:hypothetical protein
MLSAFLIRSATVLSGRYEKLSQFLDALDTQAIFGQVFSLPDESLLSFSPLISVLDLSFPSLKKSVRVEYAAQTYQELPVERFVSHSLLDEPLAALDIDKSYFAINWVYLINFKQRQRDYRAPNVLVYYKFTLGRVVVLGAQPDSLRSVW